jgi:hydrogenase maturation protease
VKKRLAYGYGNPGRQDDGLGILLVEKWEKWATAQGVEQFDFERNYQLNIEDADTIRQYDEVIFVDATVADISGVHLSKLVSTSQTEFTMHAMDPGFVLHLCQSLYGDAPDAWLLSIKAYEFEFAQALTSLAEKNLATAFELVRQLSSAKCIAEFTKRKEFFEI